MFDIYKKYCLIQCSSIGIVMTELNICPFLDLIVYNLVTVCKKTWECAAVKNCKLEIRLINIKAVTWIFCQSHARLVVFAVYSSHAGLAGKMTSYPRLFFVLRASLLFII